MLDHSYIMSQLLDEKGANRLRCATDAISIVVSDVDAVSDTTAMFLQAHIYSLHKSERCLIRMLDATIISSLG